jgi:hypothetical protein
MSGLTRMSLDSPEEVRPFEGGSGQLNLVNLDRGPVGRATFQPGWKGLLHKDYYYRRHRLRPAPPAPGAACARRRPRTGTGPSRVP